MVDMDMDMVDMDMVDMDIVVPGNRQLQWTIIGSDMPCALGLAENYTLFFISPPDGFNLLTDSSFFF